MRKSLEQSAPRALDAAAHRVSPSIIVVRLAGGLGNQLFQFAAGWATAARAGACVKVDISALTRDGLRAYGLPALGINVERATVREIWRLRYWKRSAVDRVLQRLVPAGLPSPATYIAERSERYDPRLSHLQGSAYLDGYWQSPRYFEDARERLIAELRLDSGDAQGPNRRAIAEMQRHQAVAVHVRRGDYVSNPSAAATHGVCDLAYYGRAMAWMKSRVPSPWFYVFSDDPRWAGEAFGQLPRTTVVRWNTPAAAHEDLRLMAACSHNIIANSTLSWWGAWLGTAAGRHVVAPSRWYASAKLSSDDLVPDTWVRL